MAIRSDSFSTVAEVVAFTRHTLDGHTTFGVDTRPTLTEVEKFIDRASALVNVALAKYGFTPADVYSNAVSKLTCDDWVTRQAVRYVHYTQRNTGIFSDKNEEFAMDSADEFVSEIADGLIGLGIDLSTPTANGLLFTGMGIQSGRSDPSDSTKEQPLFTRRMYDNV